MIFLKLSGITKKGEGDFLLQDITFNQRKHQKIAIAGETGAGKSTLLKIIAGLIQPDAGEIFFENEKVRGPGEQLLPGHPGIAYLSQHFELQKFLRVEQVLRYSNTLSEVTAQQLYEVCQIDHLLSRKTDQLSGGEKQRIAICRLLISTPRLLLLDEPFSHLDMVHKNTLKTVIDDIGRKLKITCILVSHDPEDTLSWADKVLVMRAGKVIQKGDPETIYKKPSNEYAGGLFGSYNLLSPAVYKKLSAVPAIRRSLKDAGNRYLFIRPEHIKIVRKNGRALKGSVSKVLFFGSYYQIMFTVNKTSIILKTEKTDLKEGEPIYISVSQEHLWFL
jgi:iron(III) transport system ATP-binding protein